MECIIYLEVDPKKNILASLPLDSLEKLPHQSGERSEYTDGSVMHFVKRTKEFLLKFYLEIKIIIRIRKVVMQTLQAL